MQVRPLNEEDRTNLASAIEKDEYHKSTTTVDFFYAPSAMCNVYEDEQGPIMAVRGTKAIRLDIQFFNNLDVERNRTALLEGFDSFVQSAKEAGFTELVFNSESPALVAFCKRYFGFHHSKGELRRFI